MAKTTPSNSLAGIPIRHRLVRQAALFPTSSQRPTIRNWTSRDLAPEAAVPSDSKPGYPSADCPPPFRFPDGAQRRAGGRTHDAGARRDADAAVESTAAASAPLVGIARPAPHSPPAESQSKSSERPEYFVLPVRSILNKCDSKRVPFEWTINPYRGCEFACKYCYARYTHEYMELDGGEFEKKIFVKKDPAA